MTLAAPIAVLSDWFDRIFSFGLVLVVASGLTLAKVLIMVGEWNKELPANWPFSSENAEVISPPSSELPSLDEDQFVPWPSILPEPAAGPETAPGSAPGDVSPSIDLSNLTEGEKLALQQLMVRRGKLDEREKTLNMRAELNGRVEAKIDQQIAQLTELKARLEELVKGLDETEELKLARLVKIYETMKPKAAAAIFDRLEMPVLIHVIERMKEAKSAAVLEKMNPAIAKRVTTELARKKERPSLEGSTVGNEA
ncbi:MAG: MotE family protein [Geminicoccales bacterium]